MIKKGSFIKYTLILQVFILLFAIATIPVSAASEAAPSFPLIVGGEITIDGEAAPVGTEITVKLGEKTVGTTTVDSEGVYGDSPANRLLITSEPDNYEDLKFYVNGVETDLIDLTNAEPGTTVAASLTAGSSSSTQSEENIITSSVEGTTSSSSSSFGDSGIGDESDEESSFESTAFAGDEDQFETIAGSSSSIEAESSSIVSGLFGLVLVSLIGIIILVKRRN